MSEHPTDSEHPTEQGGTAVADEHSHAASANGLRFEPQELESFIVDDTHAGVAIGRLLAALFCVLLALMVGATIWTARHANTSDDPYAVPAGASHDAHH